MDERGPWNLEASIREHQNLISWYAKQGIPVELNEPHHWGMRDSPDVIFVVTAYLSAYNARRFGVKDYIAQMMFNSPPGLSDKMDIAKILNHRYITEDIPMSLVPIAALGQRYGVSVRGIDSIIRLACIIHRTDYWRRGRTLEKLGINQLSVGELTRFVMEGAS